MQLLEPLFRIHTLLGGWRYNTHTYTLDEGGVCGVEVAKDGLGLILQRWVVLSFNKGIKHWLTCLYILISFLVKFINFL